MPSQKEGSLNEAWRELKRSNSGDGGGVGGGEWRWGKRSSDELSRGGTRLEGEGGGRGGRGGKNLTAAIPDGVPGVIVVVGWKEEVVFEGSSREADGVARTGMEVAMGKNSKGQVAVARSLPRVSNGKEGEIKCKSMCWQLVRSVGGRWEVATGRREDGVSGGRCDGMGEEDFGKRVHQPQASFGLVCGSALVVRGSSLRTRQASTGEGGPCSHAVARHPDEPMNRLPD